MKKYKITTAKKAVEKGLMKVGDEVWVKCKANVCFNGSIYLETEENAVIYCEKTKIRIPIHEPKPIDFGEAGRVLKHENTQSILKTTGFESEDFFSAYVLESTYDPVGYASCKWSKKYKYTDITDTYKP